MTPGQWIILFILALMWGASFIFIDVAVRSVPPLTVAALRVFLAALMLNAAMLFSGRRYPRSWKLKREFLVMGLLNNAVPFSLIIWGQRYVTAGLASILIASTPLMTLLLAHLLTSDEKLTVRRLAGVCIGIAGVFILIGPSAISGRGLWPQIAMLLAALSYACAAVYGKRFKRSGTDFLVVSSGQVTCSSLLLIPAALAVDKPWLHPFPGSDAVWAIAGLAVLSTTAAYLLYFYLLAHAGAGNALLVTMLTPFVAVLMGAVFLGQELVFREVLALGILSLGLLVIDGRLIRSKGSG